MALPVITNIYRCFIDQGGGGIEIGNVIHVEDTSGSAAAVDIAKAVGKAWGSSTGMAMAINTGTSFKQVEVIKLDGISGTVADPFSTAVNHAGIRTGTAMPYSCCACISLQTNERGRSHRGRVYLGPVCASDSSDDATWSTSGLANFTAAANGFLSALFSGSPSLTWVVASYKMSTALPVISVKTNKTIATQRMRLH